MKRLLLLWALCSPLLTQAAPYQVVMLLYRGITPAEQGFMDSLKAQLPVQFTIFDAAEDKSRLPGFIAQTKALKPDLVYAFGTTVALATVGPYDGANPARHITNIPVVCNIVADPIGAKLTRSLAGSGRNFTGVTHIVPMPDQLKAMARLGKIRQLGVIYNPQEPNSLLTVKDLAANSAPFGFTLQQVAVQPQPGGQLNPQELTAAVRQLAEKKVDYLYLPSDSSIIQQAETIITPAQAAGIPVISATEAPIRNKGAFMGLVGNYYNAGSFAAHKAVQILREHKAPGALPIEPLKRFSLVINMKAAHSLRRYPPLEAFRFAELLR